MKLELYQQKSSNLMAENRLLKLAIVLISIGVACSGIFTYVAMNQKTVVLIPPGLNKKVQVSGERFDEEYIRTFAEHIGYLAYHYTTRSARSNFDELLSYYDPDNYEAAKKLFYQTADAIETSGTTSVFYPDSVNIDTGKHLITVRGTRTLTLKGIVAEQGPRSFNIEFRVANGHFFIKKVLDVTQEKESVERDQRIDEQIAKDKKDARRAQ